MTRLCGKGGKPCKNQWARSAVVPRCGGSHGTTCQMLVPTKTCNKQNTLFLKTEKESILRTFVQTFAKLVVFAVIPCPFHRTFGKSIYLGWSFCSYWKTYNCGVILFLITLLSSHFSWSAVSWMDGLCYSTLRDAFKREWCADPLHF